MATLLNIEQSTWENVDAFKKLYLGPGQVAQLVRALSQCAKVEGLITCQGTYKKQPMNA